MVSKNKKILYVCSECGYKSNKWIGKCPECNGWNTISEEFVYNNLKNCENNDYRVKHEIILENKNLNFIDLIKENRIDTGFKELNCVLGGGIVNGSVILLSGSPGVGKSTLLLQICQFIGLTMKVFYFSGEESEKQVKLRANRLNITNENIYIFSENDVNNIIDIAETYHPGLIIIDSIQTMKNLDVNSTPGSVVQVRESTNILMNFAKKINIPIIIVGHINKDGGIAGPKVLEHIVDTVLYFECEKYNSYKILRTTKNRFGATNEIGIFDMQNSGIVEIKNPSMALLSDRSENMSGSAIVCIMEGSRSIFVEVQALVAKSDFNVPRRTSIGFDYNRTCLILAILEKKCGYSFNKLDVYVNIIGGVKLNDPSADLAVATAIISSIKDKIIDSNTVIIGELGLTGEIRPVSNITYRINECIKLGFKKCIIPKGSLKALNDDINIEKILSLIKIIPVRYIWEYFK